MSNNAKTPPIATGLNDAQRRAVEHRGSHLLVVAGPGSGKTRVLTQRIAHLIASGEQASRILAVTFTNKAASEIKARLEKTIGEEAQWIWAGTFHSICAKILRYSAQDMGLDKSFQILDSDDSERVLITLLREKNAELDTKTARASARAIKEQISLMKNQFQDPALKQLSSEYPDIGRRYQERLAKMNAFDFDDLLVRTAQHLHTPEGARWVQKFDHVLVDEFQDTNTVQLKILEALKGTAYVCAVGDAAQGIYSWRGADNAVMQKFTELFAPAEVVTLTENYRSTPEIVQVCQSILDQDPTAPFHITLETSNASGKAVVMCEFDDDRDESDYAVSKIKTGSMPPESYAILVRTIAQTRSFEERLLNAALPYVVVGGLRFYERAEIKDALAHLKAAVFPLDINALQRAASSPRRGIGPKTLETIAQNAIELGGLLTALTSYEGAKASQVHDLGAYLSAVSKAALDSPAAALKLILASGLRDAVSKAEDAEARLENLDELLAAAAEFETKNQDPEITPTLAFLEHTSLYSSADDRQQGAVQLLTIHSAKGREFPVVFLPGLEEELLPHVRSLYDTAALEEELRLFYVGASRAEKELHLTYCRQRMLFGKTHPRSPSRFLAPLKELPPTTLQIVETPHRKSPWSQGHRAAPRAATSWSAPFKNPPPPVQARQSTTPALSQEQLPKNALVSHTSFGDGVVLATGTDTVTVKFADRSRILSIALAPLTLR